ncbi:putative restriction endonuclease [Beggiatoa alba B18LD]|uniref:Putative restriction endonuclease n=1 Tax=Beggiatoa alba B18LD TaxID=395493 RepID=I3CET1_9GAMM|nr:HNH endonuclease signature motif containing protein [Beggiatoa alba]EIJ42124.1 putative restriction endonuclease [Beggiatoa alba B18LD]
MTEAELIEFIEDTFKVVGTKDISCTDINKQAYIVNKEQLKVFEHLRIQPSANGNAKEIISVRVLVSDQELKASFYGSQRTGSGRPPEIRMGREIIPYLTQNGKIIFATDGYDIFIFNLSKLAGLNMDDNAIREAIYEQINIGFLEEGIPTTRQITTTDEPTQQITTTITTFRRNNKINVYVKRKAGYKCQMPNCDYEGFDMPSGKKYIEVHHLVPLAEGGTDSLENTVAVCPTCHRKLHYATDKETLKQMIEAIGEKRFY